MSLPAGKSGFLVATADFQGVACEWCLLPGFGHDDGYSFAKYSQISNSAMKSRISHCVVKAFPLVFLTKSHSFNERSWRERNSFVWVLRGRVWGKAYTCTSVAKTACRVHRKSLVNINKEHMKTYYCIRAVILPCSIWKLTLETERGLTPPSTFILSSSKDRCFLSC